MTLAERIVQSAADAIIVADISGKITLWNAGAERLFGYTAPEALGRSLDLIIPEAQRKRHWDGYEHVMRTGETKYGTQLLRVRGRRGGICRRARRQRTLPDRKDPAEARRRVRGSGQGPK